VGFDQRLQRLNPGRDHRHDRAQGSIRDILGVWNLRRHSVASRRCPARSPRARHPAQGLQNRAIHEPPSSCAAGEFARRLRGPRAPFSGDSSMPHADNQGPLAQRDVHGLQIDSLHHQHPWRISKDTFEWFAETGPT